MNEFQDDHTSNAEESEDKITSEQLENASEDVVEEQPEELQPETQGEPENVAEELQDEPVVEEAPQLQPSMIQESEPEKPAFHQYPDYFYAGFWVRVCSYILDLWCIAAIRNCTVGFAFKVAGWERGDGFLTPYNLIGLGIYLAYFILLTKLNHGQTIGKMVFGLKVVCFKEEELSWQTVIIREGFCRFILQKNFLTYFAYLPAAFSQKKQHVGDMFTDTTVITLNTLKAFNTEAI